MFKRTSNRIIMFNDDAFDKLRLPGTTIGTGLLSSLYYFRDYYKSRPDIEIWEKCWKKSEKKTTVKES